ncbi:Mucin-associated surface protein (MASP) [Trypanosoma cruzi]|uniref:Mucin-associated surface protein (MASP), putative n=2 Tax=Trypanosoma cruzi TaxID=5693 RepID=Q4CS35_TRYCC|nr:mucin-associated surface protein (MASP), putative [Trypanosoma cruzi]EAN83086.1 mucin-associated surface protein (MASP), putative [Trypanosoma cruzi]PWU86808.1 Mucin-associated surface protein (MASP) [Trypanosoma cruzi]RNC51450.1 mucin-associated surface protein (MASP) [Trypanosoma cruzi]|eukprot:XP_804937.1 mucin-associated surface protein (MASP) [Trypanosoma cruzi strain CL Brener]
MAMMMTGRVLLVCALCVLWCGACGGYAWDFDNNSSLNEYYYGAYGVYCNASLNATFCEEKRNASKGEETALKTSTVQSENDGGQSSAGDSSGEQEQTLEESGSDRSIGNSGGQELKNPGEGEATPTEQSPSPTQPSTVSEDLPKPAAPGGSEAPGTTTELQPPPQSPLPAGGTPTPTTATPIADGPSGGRDNSSEKNGSDDSEKTDAGPQESQPPNGNVTETPTPATVTAAPTSATRTPDESDGSPAASHTTSPLLLFLLACAAAAAVVAA